MIEPLEIGVAVEREAVGGDVATAMDAYGTDLAIADPDSSVRRGIGLDAELGAHADHHMFHLVHIPPDADVELLQVEHWISHQLSGSMESDQPAAICPPELCTETSQLPLIFLRVSLVPYPYRVYWLMLQEY